MGSVKPLSAKHDSHLVVVSNRGSCVFSDTPEGVRRESSVSGLVSAVEPVLNREGGIWVAWGGRYGQGDSSGITYPVPYHDPKYIFHEVLLSKDDVDLFYDGFANSCMWPLCHNFIEKAIFNQEHWDAFCRVNERYAQVLLKVTKSKDFFWIHDYHLGLLPGYIRKQRSSARIAMFWHIPFPPAEIFAALPWADAYLRGILESELIGFHTPAYVRNFLQSVEEILRADVDYQDGLIFWEGKTIKIIAAPIGIDWREFNNLATAPDVIIESAQIRKFAGGQHLLLGVDRLDYTKGIIERLHAIAGLLEKYPRLRNRLTFLQIAVPSRTGSAGYPQLRRKIEETVGRINGLYTENYHVPVKYLFKSLNKKELVAHYLAADMALVTPVKDGLNLVAKEYVASKAGNTGVLLLSPFAGVAHQFQEALLANPYNNQEMINLIVKGLEMSLTEKHRQMALLNRINKEQDINWWWQKIRRHWLDEPEGLLNDALVGIGGGNAGVIGSFSVEPS